MVNIDILTYCSRYSYEVYDRFCGSLFDTGFQGNIHIVVHKHDLAIIKLLKIKYPKVYEIIDDLVKKTHFNCHRFYTYQKFLLNANLTCDYILLCDSRDVLFQKNIENYDFEKLLNIDIFVFAEGIKIYQDENCNSPWIKSLDKILDQKIYDEINNKDIICCGTTLGKNNAIITYVNEMCNFLTKYNIIDNLDQGIHNYFVHMNKLQPLNVKILYNIDNLVNTVGCDIKKINSANQITNVNDDVSYIVHQYDRFSDDDKQKLSIKYNFMDNDEAW